MLNALLALGFLFSVAMWFVALHNLYWCAQEFFCLTHLGLPWQAIFRLPDSERAIRARRNFVRQFLNLALMVVLWDAWRSHLIGVFELNGLWLTIPGTVIIGWQLLADALEIDKVRQR